MFRKLTSQSIWDCLWLGPSHYAEFGKKCVLVIHCNVILVKETLNSEIK